MVTPKGGEVMVIPIEKNHLFKSEKGNVYLDLMAWELKNKLADSKDTHLVKQSFKKEYLDSLTEEQRRELPILGNAAVWDGERGEAAPANVMSGKVAEGLNDLPF